MNIFKINENIACNAFSFIGYIYFVLIVINYQTKYASINPLIILIDFLAFLTVIVILLIIYFREIKIYDKHPRIRKEHKSIIILLHWNYPTYFDYTCSSFNIPDKNTLDI